MVWPFSSSPTPARPEAAPQNPPQAQTPPAQASQPAPRTRPSDDDVEVAQFLQEMMAEVKSVRESLDASKAAESAENPAANNPSSTTAPSTKSTWASRWATSAFSSSAAVSPAEETTMSEMVQEMPDSLQRLSPLAESLLPTEMNCEQAFNLAYYCQSFGGQFTSVYRYGGMRSCSENWSDFWFCMRVKSYPPGEVKENMIREHYRKKELAKYGPGKPSSEDVWTERRSRVNPGEALSARLDEHAHPMSDAEFQKWEMERYERIRNELKKGPSSS